MYIIARRSQYAVFEYWTLEGTWSQEVDQAYQYDTIESATHIAEQLGAYLFPVGQAE
jgi:hypothetical protein